MVKACHSDYAIKYDGEGIVDCNTFDNIFVVGGLYGNIEACLELLSLREEYPNSLFIFNGDLHWFDKDYEDFMLVERLTDYGIRLLGNVEAELIRKEENYEGCGCSYPDYVDVGVIERSDRIHKLMRDNMSGNEVMNDISIRKKYEVINFSGKNIFITHGDENNLAGWGCSIISLKEKNRQEEIYGWMNRNDIDIMAVTHTCDPVLLNNNGRVVANNGAAGMPNIRRESYGLITRISKSPSDDAIYSTKCGDLYVEGFPLMYNSCAFIERFVKTWPIGSDASKSYLDRIEGKLGNNIDDIVIEIKTK